MRQLLAAAVNPLPDREKTVRDALLLRGHDARRDRRRARRHREPGLPDPHQGGADAARASCRRRSRPALVATHDRASRFVEERCRDDDCQRRQRRPGSAGASPGRHRRAPYGAGGVRDPRNRAHPRNRLVGLPVLDGNRARPRTGAATVAEHQPQGGLWTRRAIWSSAAGWPRSSFPPWPRRPGWPANYVLQVPRRGLELVAHEFPAWTETWPTAQPTAERQLAAYVRRQLDLVEPGHRALLALSARNSSARP